MNFNIGEKLRCILHFVNQNGRLVKMEKHFRVVLSQRTFCQVIQRYIIARCAFHQLLQHGCFADLSGTGNDNGGILLTGLKDNMFKVTFDILHIDTSFRADSILTVV